MWNAASPPTLQAYVFLSSVITRLTPVSAREFNVRLLCLRRPFFGLATGQSHGSGFPVLANI
jgi:hypothetical protein